MQIRKVAESIAKLGQQSHVFAGSVAQDHGGKRVPRASEVEWPERYEPDDPTVLRKLFGIEVVD